MTATRSLEDDRHLLALPGPELLANLTRPLTTDEYDRVNKALAEYRPVMPVHDLVLAALDEHTVVDEAAYAQLLQAVNGGAR